MKSPRIAIVDYDAGNSTSVGHAVKHLGMAPQITRKPEEVAAADRVIFPGVGAAGASMESLRRLGLDEALRQAVSKGRPVLGICVGCQVIFDQSEEDEGTAGLGLLPGHVHRFRFEPDSDLKVPHMGWNEVTFVPDHPLFGSLKSNDYFYFVHSYYPGPTDESLVKGRCVYGDTQFAAAVARDNLAAVQFHAEKSGPAGLRLLDAILTRNP